LGKLVATVTPNVSIVSSVCAVCKYSCITGIFYAQLFSGVFADDPLFVCEVGQTIAANVEQQLAKKAQKERQVGMLNCVGKVMDTVTARHRLIDAAWETEILAKV
jgi:hypothetical protein